MKLDGLRLDPVKLGSVLAALAALSLGACASLAPAHRRPELPLPEAYAREAAAAAAGTAAPEGTPDAWWTLLGEPALDQLVEEALAGNQDLAIAAARVEEARALLGLANSDRLPQVTASTGASRNQLSARSSRLPPGVPLRTERFPAVLSLSFDLDFWGRLRNLSHAARAELLATEEGQLSVRLALAADVATAYVDLVTLDRQLEIARDTLASRRESVRLQRLRLDAGTISELDLAQAEAELAATEATVPAVERRRRQTETRLDVLLGRIGGEVERRAIDGISSPEVPVGLPSELLARRPDVRGAEQRLAAASARIGAARAAYFPSISLTGSGGSESRALSGLFGAGTTIWNVALSLVEPVFNGGKTRRQVEAARARERQALAQYTKSVQSAFAEVEDALVARRTGKSEREALERQVAALTRARRLAVLRYDSGDASYLEVLDAERNLFLAELAWSQARRGELVAAVTLFQAIGGGWQADAPGAAPAVPRRGSW